MKQLKLKSMYWLLIPILFLLIFMLIPMLELFSRSVIGEEGFTLSYFKRLFETSLYFKILGNTLGLSLVIALLTLLLGYPVAYTMNRVSRRTSLLIMACVQIPFWTSLLVRTYAWIAILQNQGMINVTLMKLGIIKEPVQLLYNTTGVLVGMTHIMLPYMIFSISAVMGRIDKNVLTASIGLGASKTQTFFKVFLPLSKSGIISGLFIVFLNSIGYYIVPALLGGQKNQMISQTIQTQLSGVLNWNFAAAISILLILTTLMILLVFKTVTASSTQKGGA